MLIGKFFFICRNENYADVSVECKTCLNHTHIQDWKKVTTGNQVSFVCLCGNAIDIKDTSDYNVRLNNFKYQREQNNESKTK